MIWDMKFWEYLFPLHLSKENNCIFFNPRNRDDIDSVKKQNITEKVQFKCESNWEKETFWASDMIKKMKSIVYFLGILLNATNLIS